MKRSKKRKKGKGGQLVPLNVADYKEEYEKAWVCLSCFNVGCGRYSDEKHALVHYEEKDSHHMVFSPSQSLLWCYACDSSISEIIENQEIEEPEKEKYQEAQTEITNKFLKIIQKAFPEKREVVEEEEESFPEVKQSALELFTNGELAENQDTGKNEKESEEEKKNGVGEESISKNLEKFDGLCAMRGLSNLGNTCFFNSCLQCLNATRPLVSRYLNYEKEFPEMKDIFERLRQKNLKKKQAEPKTKRNKAALKLIQTQYNPLNYTLGITFQQYREGRVHVNKQSYSPYLLFKEIGKRCSRFQGYQQQDAHDLFLSLMDQLMSEEMRYRKVLLRREKRQKSEGQSQEKQEQQKEEQEMNGEEGKEKEMNSNEQGAQNNDQAGEVKEEGEKEERKESTSKKSNLHEVLSQQKTLVEQVFGGFLFSSVRCFLCNNISVTFDPYLDLSLEMPKNASQNTWLSRSEKRQMAKASKKKKKKNKNYRGWGYQLSDQEEKKVEPTEPEPLDPSTQEYVFGKEEEDQRALESGDTLLNITAKIKNSLNEGEEPEEFKGKQFYIYPENQIKTQYAAVGSSLEDCLKHFCSTEYMQDAANLYFCEKCNTAAKQNNEKYEGSPALRRMMLYKPNNTLVINLKRFTQATWSIHKNSERVPFPAILDLAPFVLHESESQNCEQDFELLPQEIKLQDIDKWKYELYGVVTHSGSIHGGHYVSSVLHKDAVSGKKHWFYASDSHFRVTQLSSVLNSEAYMLFYRRIQ